MNEDFTTDSGIPLKAFYTPEDVRDIDYERDLGVPGKPPYMRGIYPLMYRDRAWQIKLIHGYQGKEEINRRAKLALERGQNRLSCSGDNPSIHGLDTDDERVHPYDIGSQGIPLNLVQDFKDLLRDLPLDKLYYEPLNYCFQPPYLALFIAAYDQRGFDRKLMRGTSDNDLVIGYVATTHAAPIPPRPTVRLYADIVEWCVENAPRWTAMGSNPGYNGRECGITAYEELALGLANAACEIDEVLRRGRLKIDDFAHMMGFHLSCDRDFFEEIAKFRAGRRMWYKLITEKYRPEKPESARFKFHVQTSGASLTRQQPLNNIPRVTYQVLAAALGGAQSINAAGYLEAVSAPTEESELISLRTEQILQHESNITSVVDPLGGSYYVEWLTNEIERKAWDYFNKIEEMGGLINVIESGWIHNEFVKRAREQEVALSSGKKKVVGVNIFEMAEEPFSVESLKHDNSEYYIQKERLAKTRAERDNAKVEQALDKLRKVLESDENSMPVFIEAAHADATLGEMCDVMREVFGVWQYPSILHLG